MAELGEFREPRRGAKEGEWDYYNIEIGDDLLRKYGFVRIGILSSSTYFKKVLRDTKITGIFIPQQKTYLLSLFFDRNYKQIALEKEIDDKLSGLEKIAQKRAEKIAILRGFPEGVKVTDVQFSLSCSPCIESVDFKEAYSKIMKAAELLGLNSSI